MCHKAKLLGKPATKFPGRAVIKDPKRNVVKLLKKPTTMFQSKTARRFPSRYITSFLGSAIIKYPERSIAWFPSMLTRYPRRLATKFPEKTANKFRSKAASSAMVLTKRKDIAKVFLGKKATHKDVRAVQKSRGEDEKAKQALSSAHQVSVEVNSLFEGEDFSETLTRAKFEELNMDLFKRILDPTKKVLEDAANADSSGKIRACSDVELANNSTGVKAFTALKEAMDEGFDIPTPRRDSSDTTTRPSLSRMFTEHISSENT